LGQLLWIGFEGPSVDAELRDSIARGRCGGVTLFARNLVTGDGGDLDVDQLLDLNRKIRAAVAANEAPLLISVDQEGGSVQRFREPATRWPPMMSLAGADEARAEAVGRALGLELAALDVDVDFAPVLDVHTNPDNPVIGERAFSTEPGRAADLALAFARGLAAAGVLGCGKHFPGHGDTATDSHLALPRVSADRERIDAVELVPFARAVAAGLPMIMTAHVVFEALDPDLPATLSPKVVRGVLRDALGYAGVVVSDDLDMKAIAAHWGIAEAAERAILAGCDVLLLCRDPEHQLAAYEGLIRAAERSSDLRAAIAAAARRVEAMKRAHFLGDRPARRGREILGCAEHRALAAELDELRQSGKSA
jgi:beta-N-acetylhexosaminidase